MTQRCPWAGTDRLYVAYHDREWGRPQRDSRHLFEMLCLEGFQAGLSWITVLRKRENFRAAFANFEPLALLAFGEGHVESLLQDAGIIRHRGKIEAVLRNARAWTEIEAQPEGFSGFIWEFVDGEPLQHRYATPADVPATTPVSDALARELKRRGFGFVGSTTCQAFMQAVGLMNDHLVSCPQHAACAREASS